MTVMNGLKSVAAVALLLMALSQSARAFEAKAFEPAAFKASQDAGQAILIDVYAPWCPTCQAQRKVLDGLKDNAAYKDVTVYEVDFDTQTDVLKAFKVQKQSTLIAFKGTTETGRSVGATQQVAIEDLLKSAAK